MPAPPPRFFISYVHHSPEDNQHVEKFYEDLDRDVRLFAGIRQQRAGFCDTSFQLGHRWSQGLVDALSTTQIFIPLLSPAYFASEACGKEWTLFESRLSRDSQVSSIIPLLWVGMRNLPAVAEEYQYKEASFGPDYEEHKLRALIRDRRHDDAYQAFVQVLADRIVELSDEHPLPPATGRPRFDEVRAAFGTAFDQQPDRTPVPRRRNGAAVRPDHVDLPILNPHASAEDAR
ncbi:TIR-like protein FxsC [Symbioplanes lichenis]|uniref:TIR-like protein FxsC n=1 Tax=Symbioplanes lichenis TaxID=1629072 RepID=UPI0027397022|nr:TIR-like protein FxsC [Actinoplanes lichenis]